MFEIRNTAESLLSEHPLTKRPIIPTSKNGKKITGNEFKSNVDTVKFTDTTFCTPQAVRANWVANKWSEILMQASISDCLFF